MAYVIKITGGPTLFDATAVVDTPIAGQTFVSGTVYPDEHPALEHGNSAVYQGGYGFDATTGLPLDGTAYLLYPIGYAWSASVPNYKLQEMIVDTNQYQLDPIGPVEKSDSAQGTIYDPAGVDSTTGS